MFKNFLKGLKFVTSALIGVPLAFAGGFLFHILYCITEGANLVAAHVRKVHFLKQQTYDPTLQALSNWFRNARDKIIGFGLSAYIDVLKEMDERFGSAIRESGTEESSGEKYELPDKDTKPELAAKKLADTASNNVKTKDDVNNKIENNLAKSSKKLADTASNNIKTKDDVNNKIENNLAKSSNTKYPRAEKLLSIFSRKAQ